MPAVVSQREASRAAMIPGPVDESTIMLVRCCAVNTRRPTTHSPFFCQTAIHRTMKMRLVAIVERLKVIKMANRLASQLMGVVAMMLTSVESNEAHVAYRMVK